MRAEYYQRQGGALVTLDWERLSGGAGWLGEYFANPNLTGQPALRRTDAGVDDADPGFVTGGSSSGWRVSAIGYGGRMTWTRNNDYQRPNHNSARFR